jgi:Ca2+:H+ antiporter
VGACLVASLRPMSEVQEDSAPAPSADQAPALAPVQASSADQGMPLPEGRRPLLWHFSRAARRTRFCKYANVLFVFIPLGLIAGIVRWSAEAVFTVNLLALVRLAPLITFSIDELSPSVGRLFGQLMQPTSGNAVEMIVSFSNQLKFTDRFSSQVGIVALSRGEPVVARTSLLGSIISYALLVGTPIPISAYESDGLPPRCLAAAFS